MNYKTKILHPTHKILFFFFVFPEQRRNRILLLVSSIFLSLHLHSTLLLMPNCMTALLLVFFFSHACTLLNRLHVSSFATKGKSLTNYSSSPPWLLFRKSLLNLCSLTSIYESFICHCQVVRLTQ